jgi:hypothetical protein
VKYAKNGTGRTSWHLFPQPVIEKRGGNWFLGAGLAKNKFCTDPDPGSGSGMENLDHIYESWETIFLVKILKFFDMHPGSRIWDGKNSNQGSRMEKIWIQDPGSGMGNIRIRDKHPRSAKLEISLPNLLGLKEPKNNQTLSGKGI